MAKYNSIAVGHATGSAGDITFSQCFGVKYFKQKATQVANPKTDAQQFQRNKIAILLLIYNAMQSFIQVAFKQAAIQMSSYNAFMSVNLRNAFSGTGTTPILEVDDMKVSSGTLPNPSDIAAGSPTGRVVPITWTSNAGVGSASASDALSITAISTDGTEVYNELTGEERSDETSSYTVPGSTAMGSIHLFATFINASGSKAGDSVYLGLAS